MHRDVVHVPDSSFALQSPTLSRVILTLFYLARAKGRGDVAYLGHESHTVDVRGTEVSAVQWDLHLSQEGVAAEATMMPNWDQ